MIGLLNAYHFDKDPNTYQKDYGPMCLSYLHEILPGSEIKSYLVAQNEFPADIHECEGYIITGSPASCYDDDEWIKKLEKFIKDCHQAKVKLFGICFGHQIIANSLGGVVEKSDKGWGIGVMSANFTHAKPWMKELNRPNYSMLYSHQDQVVKAPTNALVLAKSDFCPISAFSIDEHIFCLQGHPEFTRDYAKSRYDTRKEAIGIDTYKKAMDHLNDTTDEKTIGKWIRNFFKN